MASSWQQFEEPPLRSLKDLARRSFELGDPSVERDAVREIWEHECTRRMRDHLDGVGLQVGEEAKKYPSSVLFAIHLVARRLTMPLRTAYNRVRGDDELREILGIAPREAPGLYSPFPTRQLVANFVNHWLPNSVGSVEFLKREAYILLPALIMAEHHVDGGKIGMDCMVIKSPNGGPRRERKDDGAGWIIRTKEGHKTRTWGRLKATFFAAGDAPLILASKCVFRPSEPELMRELLRELAEYSNAVALVIDNIRGTTGHPGYRGADLCGDKAFVNNPMIEAIYEQAMRFVMRAPREQHRAVEGSIISTSRERHRHVVDICNDGVFYCSCDRDEKHRTEMKRAPQKSGLHGGLYVTCLSGCAEGRDRGWYVPYHARILPAGAKAATSQTSKGSVKLWLTTPTDPSSKRAKAIDHQVTNAIESHHSAQRGKLALGNGPARFWGQPAHDFNYALGDYIFNFDVGINLANNGKGKVVSHGYRAKQAGFNDDRVEENRRLAEEAAAREAAESSKAALASVGISD